MFNVKTADQLKPGDIVHYGLITIIELLKSEYTANQVHLTFLTGHTELFSVDSQFLVFEELNDLQPAMLALSSLDCTNKMRATLITSNMIQKASKD